MVISLVLELSMNAVSFAIRLYSAMRRCLLGASFFCFFTWTNFLSATEIQKEDIRALLPERANCAELAEAANYFISLGEVRAVGKLRELAEAKLGYYSSESEMRRFGWLCRTLFIPRQGMAVRSIRDGPIGFPIDDLNKAEWPYYPLAESSGVLFVLKGTRGFGVSGGPESPAEYLNYCIKGGTFRTDPLKIPTEEKAVSAMNKLLAVPVWANLQKQKGFIPEYDLPVMIESLRKQTVPVDPLQPGSMSHRLSLRLLFQPQNRKDSAYFKVFLKNQTWKTLEVRVNPKAFHGKFVVLENKREEPRMFFEKKYREMLGVGTFAEPIVSMLPQEEISWVIPLPELRDVQGKPITEMELQGALVNVELSLVGIVPPNKSYIVSNARQVSSLITIGVRKKKK